LTAFHKAQEDRSFQKESMIKLPQNLNFTKHFILENTFMALNLLLKERIPFLTKAEQKLANYILLHDDEAIFLNVEKLAEKMNVSKATVVRFSRTLGFKRYSEFQKELRSFFRSKLTTTTRLQKAIGHGTDERDILVNVLQQDVFNITETLKQISVEEFRQFIKIIDSTEKIVIIGLRSTYSLAFYLGIHLEYLQKNVQILLPGVGNMWDRLLRLTKDDVVIGITFPRYTKTTIDVFRFAKTQGVKALAITDSLVSPIAEIADNVLLARYEAESFIESLTSAFSIINAIVTALGVFNKKRSLESLKELETIWKAQKVFYI
jgi:DNA-binding MurR/RpiR family transcriptional regulator